ncbi:hypothetical protein ASAC_0593 [Acidilobus saccharovorans 345-15]|uniref:Uncharacterized protein n=1 Tax=Acidilobus saccharovorans (strain DSM 16705 / JCM 18335 / VKM B-2471 / 345-15) TaxID=666510 RepID=D9Q112_ACIS3|nr:hypothetical protein ASAC_0593 [Acidilobus saccharovorans 345-15]
MAKMLGRSKLWGEGRAAASVLAGRALGITIIKKVVAERA